MTTDICGSLFIWAVIGFLTCQPFVITYRHRKAIHRMLERNGATKIEVSWLPFRLSRSSRTYLVTYENGKGKKRERECMIWKYGLDIEWKDKD
ncbi:MAG: hypothetical protein JNM55_20160 [Anaerolineales bacterium]|nr:hypothetical protein [Anaerolineales bacterium]